MPHPREPWERLLDELRGHGFVVEPGLSDAEVCAAEGRFGFRFPPDLRALLQTGLPLGEGFPDWRDGAEPVLRARLDWPQEGMAFDIEEGSFWPPGWGPQPAAVESALADQLAAQLVGGAPRLIPVSSYRYLPADPPTAGNPIFSVHETDVVLYGRDLLGYFAREFPGVAKWHTPPPDVRPIRFWGDLAG